MPVRIKLALSVVTVLVAIAAFLFQRALGHDRLQYLVLFLGAFMVFAMWLFPEVKREETAGGVRRGLGRTGHERQGRVDHGRTLVRRSVRMCQQHSGLHPGRAAR